MRREEECVSGVGPSDTTVFSFVSVVALAREGTAADRPFMTQE
jgi:hypothetical protein